MLLFMVGLHITLFAATYKQVQTYNS